MRTLVERRREIPPSSYRGFSFGLFLVEGESNLNSYRDYDGDIGKSQCQIYSSFLDWYERIGLPSEAAHLSPVVFFSVAWNSRLGHRHRPLSPVLFFSDESNSRVEN